MSYRILSVHNKYQIPGGEDVVFENEAKLLEEHGHTVIRYVRNNSELNTMSKPEKLLVPLATIYSKKTEEEISRIIREEHIDLVHVHNTLLLISPSVYDAAIKAHVPLVQTIHNFRMICPAGICFRDGKICEECVERGLFSAVKHKCYRGSLPQSLLLTVSMRFHRLRNIYRKIHYIVLTEFNRKMLMKEGQIALRQIDVKPNFTDAPDRIVPFKERKKQIVFAGRLDPTKGVDFLLRLAEAVKDSDWQFAILGNGPMEEECRKFAEEKNLTNVTFRGFVPHEEAMREIAESRALILPTRWYEGFPMTIVEALACGTPCIVPNLGNAGSIIREGISGYHYLPEDLSTCKAVLEKNFDINERVRSEFDQNYSREANYRILMEIYGKVIREYGK